jgi:type IV pilus assembly protein PilM
VRIRRGGPESSIGLDIGHSAVKVAVLEGSRVTAWAVVELPTGAVRGGLVRDVQGVAEIVRQAAGRTGVADRPVYSALSGAACVVRRLSLPHLNGRVLRGAIRWEAERLLPYPFDQSVVDYRVLGTSMNGAGQELDILMVGARAEAVQSYVATLQGAGVRLGGLDVKPLARARALDQDLDRSAAVILHVGSESLEFTAVDERGVRFTRTVPIAAPDPHHTAVPLEFLIEETVRSMRFIEGQMPAPVDRLLLTGGGATDPAILSALEQRLNVKVVVADPLSGLQHDAAPAQRLRLAVAVGLARQGTGDRLTPKRKAIWQ